MELLDDLDGIDHSCAAGGSFCAAGFEAAYRTLIACMVGTSSAF